MTKLVSFTFGIALVSAAHFSHAQTFELRAGSGATLTGNRFLIAPGSSFTVEVWYVSPHAGPNVNVGSIALAFDRTNGVNTNATGLDNKLSIVSNTVFGGVRSASGTWRAFEKSLGTDFSIRAAATDMGPGNNYGFMAGAARPLTAYQSIQTPIGTSGAFDGDLKVMEFVVNGSALANGETYGDAFGEAGLFLAHQGEGPLGPQIGSSGWHGTDSYMRVGSNRKYMVQAVPEPATMVAVAAGLAAFARRRRGK